MPNYCLNRIKITSTKDRNLRQWMDQLYEETMNWLKETPALPTETLQSGRVVDRTINEDKFDRERFSLYYCCKPPCKTWNPFWSGMNFGTDRDMYKDQNITIKEDIIEILADTASAPPLTAFKFLTERFKDIHVILEFEEQNENFAGDAIIEKGSIRLNECTYKELYVNRLNQKHPEATVIELDEEDYGERIDFLDDLGVQYEVSDSYENIIVVYSKDDAVLAKLVK